MTKVNTAEKCAENLLYNIYHNRHKMYRGTKVIIITITLAIKSFISA